LNDSGQIVPRFGFVLRLTLIKVKYHNLLEALWIYTFAGFTKTLAFFG